LNFVQLWDMMWLTGLGMHMPLRIRVLSLVMAAALPLAGFGPARRYVAWQ
jgi:hypothetical protein